MYLMIQSQIFITIYKLIFTMLVFIQVEIYVEFITVNEIIYLEQSYQRALRVDPSYRAAAECLAIVLTDIGTNTKLAGFTQDGIKKYFEALKVDPHYAVIFLYSEYFAFITKAINFV